MCFSPDLAPYCVPRFPGLLFVSASVGAFTRSTPARAPCRWRVSREHETLLTDREGPNRVGLCDYLVTRRISSSVLSDGPRFVTLAVFAGH
jgi:hypothetical protein